MGIAGHWIWQDVHAQPVSHASFALQNTALQSHPQQRIRVLELGSGCGIVSIMLALQRPQWQIDAVEIQPELCHIAAENALQCAVPVTFLNADLTTYTAEQPYDLIVANPPWLKKDSGIYSPWDSRNISRFELACSMPDIINCLKRNMAERGSSILLYPINRMEDLTAAAQETLLDIKADFPVAGLKDHVICHLRHQGQLL